MSKQSTYTDQIIYAMSILPERLLPRQRALFFDSGLFTPKEIDHIFSEARKRRAETIPKHQRARRSKRETGDHP